MVTMKLLRGSAMYRQSLVLTNEPIRWQRLAEFSEDSVIIWEAVSQMIARLRSLIRRYLLSLRAHGTRHEKRAAWKLLHPPRAQRVNAREL